MSLLPPYIPPIPLKALNNQERTSSNTSREILMVVGSDRGLCGKFNTSIPLTDKQIYKRDIKWIEGSSLMIAEISGASLGVGFEIAYTLFQRKIPVLALANAEVPKISAMISGCESELLTIKNYQDSDEMKFIIQNFISNISG